MKGKVKLIDKGRQIGQHQERQRAKEVASAGTVRMQFPKERIQACRSRAVRLNNSGSEAAGPAVEISMSMIPPGFESLFNVPPTNDVFVEQPPQIPLQS